MTHNEHNGWWNYETWIAALWLENDEGSAEWVRDQANTALDNPGAYSSPVGTNEDAAVSALEDSIKAFHEENLPELTGFAADLLNAAMSEINWREIARHYISEAVEEAAL